MSGWLGLCNWILKKGCFLFEKIFRERKRDFFGEREVQTVRTKIPEITPVIFFFLFKRFFFYIFRPNFIMSALFFFTFS